MADSPPPLFPLSGIGIGFRRISFRSVPIFLPGFLGTVQPWSRRLRDRVAPLATRESRLSERVIDRGVAAVTRLSRDAI